MLHVVQTITSLNPASGGTAQVVPQLSDALVEQGCHVSVAYLREPTNRAVALQKAVAAPARALHVFGRAVWSQEFSAVIRRGLPHGQPRLIHDNGLWSYTNFIAGSCARRFKIPLVISPHGMLEAWAMGYKRRKKRIARCLYQQDILDAATLFIVSAESELESLRREGLRQAAAVAPPGITLPATTATHALEAEQRKILFLSRVHPKKGLIPFAEAWQRARQPGWKVIVAGPDEGGHRAEVEAFIARCGLSSDFEFTGEVHGEAKEELFRAADLFVLPTFSENFGMAVAEALSYGLPVLTTRAAPWSILEAIGAGWWVEPSVADIATGLRSALSTSARQRASMGLAGRTYVAEHFGWSTTATKVHHAYEWLLGLRAARPGHVHAH